MPLLETSGVFDALALPAFVVGKDARILAANAAAKLYFGEAPAGTPLFLKFRLPEIRAAFDDALKSDTTKNFDYHERVPLERWFRVDVSPLKDAQNKTTGCLLVFRDTSESRNIERMRADFVANASHELRTPLASLTGFIETLRGPARNDQKVRDGFLNIMLTQAKRMSRLIDDLLSLSRLEMRPYADLTEDINLTALTSQVVDTLGPMASGIGVKIETKLQTESLSITGIRDEIVEVMENLIENGCKYGRSGGKVEVSLREGTGLERGEILFTVKDFGPGIPPEHIPRLTERFYRGDAGNDPSQKGTGLGLAIVKHILSRHHARLTIHSEPGKGASFVVRFPILT